MKNSIKFLMMAATAVLMHACTKEPMQSLVPKTVDQDGSLPSITVNGAQLHSEAFGHPNSDLIVVLHGGPGGDYRELLNLKDLADHGYRVVFFDQRGSGLSQRFSKKSYTTQGMQTLETFYNDISGVIAHYRTSPDQKVYLIGQSWGGMLATAYAGRYPNAINGLVVSEPGGLKWEDVEEYNKQSRSFKLWDEALSDASFIDQFISGKEDQHEILDYKLAMLAAKNEITGEDLAGPNSFWRHGAVVNIALFEIGKDHKPDFSNGLNLFNKKVLYLYSSQNQIYTDSWAQKISASFNNAELHKIQGVGHSGIFTNHSIWTQTTMPQIINYINSL